MVKWMRIRSTLSPIGPKTQRKETTESASATFLHSLDWKRPLVSHPSEHLTTVNEKLMGLTPVT